MNIQIVKKISTTVAALALVMGTSVVNANSISLVNTNPLDGTPANIDPIVDLAMGGTFSMDLKVTTTENVGFGLTTLSWDAAVLQLDTIALGVSQFNFGVANTITASSATIQATSLVNTPLTNFTWATLNFTYLGAGSTLIGVNPVTNPQGVDGWAVRGTGTPISFTNPGDSINGASVGVSAVPLPPAFLLLGSALVGLGFTGRRKAIAA